MSRNLQFIGQLHNTFSTELGLTFFESPLASNIGLYRYQPEVNKKLKQYKMLGRSKIHV